MKEFAIGTKVQSGKHCFTVVRGFVGPQIWNIGRHNFPYEGYIPMCVADGKGYVNINLLTMCKVDDEYLALCLLYIAGHRTVDAKLYNKVCDEYRRLKSEGATFNIVGDTCIKHPVVCGEYESRWFKKCINK